MNRDDRIEQMIHLQRPDCFICGKKHEGIIGGAGMNYYVCSNLCHRKLAMRIKNKMLPYNRQSLIYTSEQMTRIRIKQLNHSDKKAKAEAVTYRNIIKLLILDLVDAESEIIDDSCCDPVKNGSQECLDTPCSDCIARYLKKKKKRLVDKYLGGK